MSRRFRRRAPGWTFAAAALLVLIAWRLATTQPHAAAKIIAGDAQVVDIIDGRTLLVQQGHSGPTLLRLLGVVITDKKRASPAKDASTNEASTNEVATQQWLRERLMEQNVQIELDHRRLDRDGVSLAYVLLGDRLINAELISHGWAVPENYPGDSAARGKQLREAASSESRHYQTR